jgi:hypothetical protein
VVSVGRKKIPRSYQPLRGLNGASKLKNSTDMSMTMADTNSPIFFK